MLKNEEKKQEEPKVAQQVVPMHDETPHTYPRPEMLTGVTLSRKTPFGTAYITINSDEFGCPFEVFITIGKAGSDLQADAEGLGRMISLQLRTTPPQHRKEMLKLVIEQLRGIGGTRASGFGAGRVISLPDAVGAVLEKFVHSSPEIAAAQEIINKSVTNGHASAEKSTNGNGKVHSNGHSNGHGSIMGADMCPSCGTISLVRAEGCRKCLTCDYSEC
jgi:ribonucleoside-diphosphate reductase alpha chain